jgi:phosphonate transport system substrate-binding protein
MPPLSLLFPPSLGQIRAHARAEVLAQSLGSRLGQSLEVTVAASYGDLERRVLEAEVDLAWAPPSICARAEREARAIFKVVRFGCSSYHAALVGRADDPPAIETGAGLRAAWVDPLATAGYLLPLAHLRQLGRDPAEAFASETFAGSYQGALLAVLSGSADVASIYCTSPTEEAAQRCLEENVGASAAHLTAVAFTPAAPADGLIVTARVKNDELIDAVERAVDGSLGPTLLLELFDADRLERAAPDDYAALRRALDDPTTESPAQDNP